MQRQLHLEGPALEPLLQQARAEHGDAATVVSAQRVRTGGFAGFFSREHFELTIDVSTDARPEPSPEPTEPADPRPASVRVDQRGSAAPGSIEELLAAADRADVAVTPAAATVSGATTRVPAPSVATGSTRVPVPAPAPTAEPAATAPDATGGPGWASGEPDVGPRRPGRRLSTESRGFDDVLAALRAELLGADAGPLDAHVPAPRPTDAPAPQPAAADVFSPWQPLVLAEDPPAPTPGAAPADEADAAGHDTVHLVPYELAPVTLAPVTLAPVSLAPVPLAPVAGGTEVAAGEVVTAGTEPAGAGPAGAVTAEVQPAEVQPAQTAATHVGTAHAERPHTGAAGVEAAAGALCATELVPLARLVGADPTRAAVAAAEVAASGCTSLRHALPVLAASLAQVVAAPGASEAAVDGTDAALLWAAPGDLVVVLGSSETVSAAARDVATELATTHLVGWPDEGRGSRSDAAATVGPDDDLAHLRARARRDGMPLVVGLADTSLAAGAPPRLAGTGRAATLRALDADLVVLAVDADASLRRQHAVCARVSDACGSRPLVLSLLGCSSAAAPLVSCRWPVVLLDGRPATVGAWTGVLLDALRWVQQP